MKSLCRLGIRSPADLLYFFIVSAYAVAIFLLLLAAIARDFGVISFAADHERPVVADFTPLTILFTISITTLAILFLTLGFASLAFNPKEIDPDSLEIRSPTLSILIPAHNEEYVIGDLVQDLLNQDYPHFEVIVIAHNCRDRTEQVLASLHDSRLKILSLRTPHLGKALALNFGFLHSRGELIAQFDADNRVHDPKFLRRAVAYFLEETQTDVIQAQIETKNEDANLLTRLQALEYRVFSRFFWGGRNVLGLPSPIAGTGVLFRRRILERVGGWDNELVEDYDLYCKLVLVGARIEFKPDLVAYDEKPPSWRLLIRQRSRWQRGHIEVLAKRWRRWLGLTDTIYLAAPLANGAWYASTALTVLRYVMPWSFTYWYPPAVLWLLMWSTALALMGILLVRTGYRRDLRYLPLLYLYSFHWLLAFLLAFRVKGWASSKTPHGLLE